MSTRVGGNCRLVARGGVPLLVLVCLAGNASADDQQRDKARDEALAAQRFELMQKRVAAVEIHSKEKEFPKAFAATPIFKYSDPVRGYVAAAVWKLGDEGRPKALLTSELHRAYFGKPTLSF